MKFFNRHLDLIGFMTSGLCAVHCLLLPLLLSLGALNSWMTEDHRVVELSILLVTAVLLGVSAFRNLMISQSPRIFILFGLGLLLLLAGFFTGTSSAHLVMAIGGIFVATAHFSSWSMVRLYARKVQ